MSRVKVLVGPNTDLMREPGSAVTLYVHCLALSRWQNRGSMGLLFDNFGDVLRTKFDSKVDSGELLLGDAHFVRVKKPDLPPDRKLWVCNLMCLTISQRKVMIDRAALSTALTQLGLFLTTRDTTLPTTIHFIIPRGVEFDLHAATPAAAAAALASLASTTSPATTTTTPPLPPSADLPAIVALTQKHLLTPRDNVEVYAQAPSREVAKVLAPLFDAVRGGGGGGGGEGESVAARAGGGERGGAAGGGAGAVDVGDAPAPTLVVREDGASGGDGAGGGGGGGVGMDVEPTLRMGDEDGGGGGGGGGGGFGDGRGESGTTASASLLVVGGGGAGGSGSGSGSPSGSGSVEGQGVVSGWRVAPSPTLSSIRAAAAVGEFYRGVKVCVLGHTSSGVTGDAVVGAVANVLRVAPPTTAAVTAEAVAVVELLRSFGLGTRPLPIKGQMGEAEGDERCVVVLPLVVRGEGDEEAAVQVVAVSAARVCGWEMAVDGVSAFCDASYCDDVAILAGHAR